MGAPKPEEVLRGIPKVRLWDQIDYFFVSKPDEAIVGKIAGILGEAGDLGVAIRAIRKAQSSLSGLRISRSIPCRESAASNTEQEPVSGSCHAQEGEQLVSGESAEGGHSLAKAPAFMIGQNMDGDDPTENLAGQVVRALCEERCSYYQALGVLFWVEWTVKSAPLAAR